MTPIKLTIEGLYSYKTRQTIDFSTLTRAKLFGIFGGVGSGKSSILEAICFALYGESERLSKQDNRGYNMMNLQSSEMLIDFEFYNKTETDRYRFTVKSKRSKTNLDEIRTPKRIAYKLKNNDWEAMESANAEEILGINYNNFKRTVIIPQGKFMEFIQLKPAERTKMLKELFNLHQYELFPQAVSIENRCKEEIFKLQGALGQLGDVDRTTIATLETQARATASKNAEIADKLARQELECLHFSKLKEVSEQKDTLATKLSELEKQMPEMQKRKENADRYSNALTDFKELIPLYHKTSERKKHLEVHTIELTKEHEQATQNYAFISNEIAELEKKSDNDNAIRARIRDLEMILQAMQKKKDIDTYSSRITEGNKAVNKAKQEIASTSLAIEKLEGNAHALVHVRKELQQQLSNKSILAEYASADTIVQSTKNRLLEVEQKIKDTLAEQKNILLNIGMPTNATEQDIDIALKNLKAQKKAEQTSIQTLLVSKKMHEAAINLQDGTPCPVCGSTTHPQKATKKEIAQTLSSTEEKLRSTESAINDIMQGKTLRAKLHTELSELSELRSRLDKQLHSDTIARNLILGKLDGPFTPMATIEKKIFDLEKKNLMLENTEREIKKKAEALQDLTKKEQKYNSALQQIKDNLTTATAQFDTICSNLSTLSFHDVEHTLPADIEAEKQASAQELETRTRLLKEKSATKHNLAEQMGKLNGQLDGTKTELASLSSELTTIEAKLADRLDKGEWHSIDSVSKILQNRIDVEAEKKAFDAFHLSIELNKDRINELEKHFPNSTYDKNLHEATTKAFDELKKEASNLQISLATTTSVIAELKEKLAKKKQLESELLTLQHKADNIKTVKDLFKGAGFVNYVSSVYLQNLCNSANNRFQKLSKNKLRLELAPDNSFLVRDYMNNGELRSIKTLSGGQSFQAALSLALALSDSVQLHNNYTQNFFFLDEGFGSQDEESLLLIFETFASLRAENKTVGIISHVNSLKEQIGAYAEVINTDLEGSSIVQ